MLDVLEYYLSTKESLWPPWTLKKRAAEREMKDGVQREIEIVKDNIEENCRIKNWLELCVKARELGEWDYELWRFMISISDEWFLESRVELAENAYNILKELDEKRKGPYAQCTN